MAALPQYAPDGHCRQVSLPAAGCQLPAAHAVGVMLPATQKYPAGHVVIGATTPGPHKKPGGQGYAGAVAPAAGHTHPAVHVVHVDADVAPTALLNVPGGHNVGAALPAGQYAPTTHRAPVTPSVGVLVLAPDTHVYPAAHTPVGAVSADVLQYMVAGHGVHSPTPASPLRLLNVDTGHATCVATAVPAGHTYPAGHATGVTCPARQYVRAGQLRHDDAPGASMYDPAAHAVGDDTPAMQYDPAGHGDSVPFTLPPVQ